MDDADIAQDLIERRLEAEERRARIAARPEFDMNFDGVHCVECGADMPEVRLKLGKCRCIECQKDFEKRKRAYDMRPREYDNELENL